MAKKITKKIQAIRKVSPNGRVVLIAPERRSGAACAGTYPLTMADFDEGFDTPQQVALADWPPASHARIVSVEVRGDRAEVLLDMDPTYDYWVYCIRVDGRWYETVSGNAPTTGWDDPNEIDWSW